MSKLKFRYDSGLEVWVAQGEHSTVRYEIGKDYPYYYVQCNTCRLCSPDLLFTSRTEAIDYANEVEKAFELIDLLVDLDIRMTWPNGDLVGDIAWNLCYLSKVKYIYCPSPYCTKKFVEFSKCLANMYHIGRPIVWNPDDPYTPALFELDDPEDCNYFKQVDTPWFKLFK